MVQQNAGSQTKQVPGLFITILWTWLLVGTLDGTGASINYLVVTGNSPVRVFQYIASAVFGKDAYSGSRVMIGLGIFFHYIVALSFTIFFFVLVPRLKFMRTYKGLTAIFYAIFMWAVMTFLVLPLTRIPKGILHLKGVLIGISILVIAIGLPLTFIANAYYSKKQAVGTVSS